MEAIRRIAELGDNAMDKNHAELAFDVLADLGLSPTKIEVGEQAHIFIELGELLNARFKKKKLLRAWMKTPHSILGDRTPEEELLLNDPIKNETFLDYVKYGRH
jgi:hypothetical protein